MNEIEVKFLGLGYNEFYQAKVQIYDLSGNLIYQDKTYNGKLKICLKKGIIYRIKAKSLNEVICNCIYITDRKKYVFIFERAKFISNQSRLVTFILTDYYYDNLSIEKGELYLWQK